MSNSLITIISAVAIFIISNIQTIVVFLFPNSDKAQIDKLCELLELILKILLEQIGKLQV